MLTVKKKAGTGLGCFFAVIAVFVLLIVLAIFTFASAISGTEFSPNTFQTRTFTYSRVPWTRIRIAPTKLGAITNIASIDVLKHLSTSSRAQEWHVVRISGAPGESHGAEILVDALGQRTVDGMNMWGTWSTTYPNAATVFWPLVQQVSFQQLYECIPELMEVAETVNDPVMLEKEALAVITRTVSERIQRSTEEAQTTELLVWMSRIPVVDPNNGLWFSQQKVELDKARH